MKICGRDLYSLGPVERQPHGDKAQLLQLSNLNACCVKIQFVVNLQRKARCFFEFVNGTNRAKGVHVSRRVCEVGSVAILRMIDRRFKARRR